MKRLLNVTTYDTEVLELLDRLKEHRKQSVYVVAAIRYFSESEQGQKLLEMLTGKGKTKPSTTHNEGEAGGHDKQDGGKPKTVNLDKMFK